MGLRTAGIQGVDARNEVKRVTDPEHQGHDANQELSVLRPDRLTRVSPSVMTTTRYAMSNIDSMILSIVPSPIAFYVPVWWKSSPECWCKFSFR